MHVICFERKREAPEKCTLTNKSSWNTIVKESYVASVVSDPYSNVFISIPGLKGISNDL